MKGRGFENRSIVLGYIKEKELKVFKIKHIDVPLKAGQISNALRDLHKDGIIKKYNVSETWEMIILNEH